MLSEWEVFNDSVGPSRKSAARSRASLSGTGSKRVGTNPRPNSNSEPAVAFTGIGKELICSYACSLIKAPGGVLSETVHRCSRRHRRKYGVEFTSARLVGDMRAARRVKCGDRDGQRYQCELAPSVEQGRGGTRLDNDSPHPQPRRRRRRHRNLRLPSSLHCSCQHRRPQVEIRIELHRSGISVSVTWPVVAAAECAIWLRKM